MAATRDKNSIDNYSLEQRALENTRNNLEYINGPNGRAVNPALPVSYLGGYMPADNLSYNSIDIESDLFGVGSTNLINSKPPVLPQLKTLPMVSFFDRNNIIIDKKITPDYTQRPQI